MIDVTFDSFSLQSNDYIVENITGYGSSPIRLQLERLAQKDGAVEVDRELSEKTITVRGTFTADTVALTDLKVDEFLEAMNKRQKALIVDWGDSIREFVASSGEIALQRPRGLNYVEYSVDFIIASGFGEDPAALVLLDVDNISSSLSSNISVQGSYKAEPFVSVSFGTITGTAPNFVTISNGFNFIGITVTRTWTSGDTLEIDSLNKTVFVNDEVVEYSGRFPQFDPGSGVLEYTDDLTTRDVTVTATYTPRYL